MRQFLLQTKWQFQLLAKNNVITISFVVTAIYGILFYAIRDLGNMEKILTLLILNDPAVIGLFFIGLMIIIERNQQVLSALFTTPINHHAYLISRIVSLSIICWICALGMAYSALGTSFHLIHFSMGVLGISIISCLAGVYIVCYTREFMAFTLKSIPILLLFINIPVLNYFEVTDIGIFKLFPAQGSLDLITNSYLATPGFSSLIFGYISMAVWIPPLYWFVYRTFITKIVMA
jgi:fluoroquinolone transport system permease protein